MNRLQQGARTHPWYLVALTIIAVLSLSLASPRPATTQEVPPSALASQFFTAVDGTSPFFMLSTDATLHTPEGIFVGMTGAAQFGETLGESFSNLEFTPGTIAEAGDDTVLASFTMTGINTGSYHGLDASCASISVDAVALLELEEREVISEHWQQLPWEMDEVPPPTETQLLVTELLVTYDSDAIERQIASTNALDSTYRPGCTTYGGPIAPGVDDVVDPMPDCLAHNVCQLPW